MTVPPDANVLLGIGLAFIAAVVWLVRLEGNVKRHDERLSEVTRRADEFRSDIKEVKENTNRIAVSIAKIEGMLDNGQESD